MSKVMGDYNLHGKVTYTVTDNGSNFVKAIEEFTVSFIYNSYISFFLYLMITMNFSIAVSKCFQRR